MNRRNFMKSWVVTGAAIVGVQAGIGAAAPAKPSLVPVAYDSYCVDSPLRDRGYAAPDLGEIDLNNPLESIAKLVVQPDWYGPGLDQTFEIKPGATNKFTMISPGDPDEDDDEPWVEEVKINYSPEFHRSTKYVLSVDAGSIYFVFTLKPEHLEIVLAKLGLGKE